MDARLKKAYFDPAAPASFGGVTKLARYVKGATVEGARRWLSGERVYTLHKPARKRYRRLKTVTSGPFVQFQADLMDLQKLSRENDGYKYVVLFIDIFTRYVWCRPIKRKTPEETTAVLQAIIEESGRQPYTIQTDQGTEFLGSFKKFCKAKGIEHFYTRSESKSALAERAIRTIKNKLYRYFTHKGARRYVDVLPDIVRSYNNTYHSVIKTSPAKVTALNAAEVFNRQYMTDKRTIKTKKLKFAKDDTVLVSVIKKPFEKGYLPTFGGETFWIHEARETQPTTYLLRDYNGEVLEGVFYDEELQKVKASEKWKIEKILRSRKNKAGEKFVLVRWLDWGPEYDSWVPAKGIENVE